MHGDLDQIAREKALKAFRTGEIDVLVATDVAARGIDIDDITHVINYQIPEDEQAYVHRIGRTGRAGKTGIAVTLVDWDELPRWTMIDKALGLGHPDPAETYSSSPHLYDELDIPTDATGRIGPASAPPRPPSARRARPARDAAPARAPGRVAAPAAAKPVERLTPQGDKAGRAVRQRRQAAAADGVTAPRRKRRRRRPRKAAAATAN